MIPLNEIVFFLKREFSLIFTRELCTRIQFMLLIDNLQAIEYATDLFLFFIFSIGNLKFYFLFSKQNNVTRKFFLSSF